MREEPSPGQGRGFGWEELLEGRVVYEGRGVRSGERRERWGLLWSHILFGGPDVLRGGFGKEGRPV